MNVRADALSAEYLSCLEDYLRGQEEDALASAYELGRKANTRGLGILQLLAVHQQALDTVLRRAKTRDELLRVSLTAHRMLIESMASFEMTNRGFRDAYEALVRSNRDLEQRTAELENANRELESFSYSISHDLRAPLRAINGFSRILLQDYLDKLDAEGIDCLKRVSNASEFMDQLIDGLLQMARTGRAEIRRVTVDLSALAREIADGLQEASPTRRVQLEIADGMKAQGDPILLRAALQNLMGNAWKFTRHRDLARIEVGTSKVDGQDAFLVRDNGSGFDMAYANKLFRPFQRLHDATQFEGVGVGLATVRKIVERHGGRVWAEGAVDKGATFYFTIPQKTPTK